MFRDKCEFSRAMTVEPILNIKTSGFVPSAKSSKYLELLSMVEVVDHMFVD